MGLFQEQKIANQRGGTANRERQLRGSLVCGKWGKDWPWPLVLGEEKERGEAGGHWLAFVGWQSKEEDRWSQMGVRFFVFFFWQVSVSGSLW